jgi:hypothetical protein
LDQVPAEVLRSIPRGIAIPAPIRCPSAYLRSPPLTGKRAFDGANSASVIAAILERPAPSVTEVAPAALDRMLKKCLEKDPDERWQSAHDLKKSGARACVFPERDVTGPKPHVNSALTYNVPVTPGVQEKNTMRISMKSRLQLAAVPFLVILVSSPGWSLTGPTNKNCPVEPAQDVAIVSGETYWGSNCVLHTIADVDSFQFNSSAGQTWTMVLGLGATANTQITLTLLAPNSSGGTHIFQGSTCTYCEVPGPTLYSVTATVTLPISGTYTVVVTETSSVVQTYGLSLEEINPLPSDGIPLTLGQSVNGLVNPPTAQNAFTLTASQSGTYEIVVQLAPNPAQQVCLTTYDPSGKTVSRNCTCTFCEVPGPPSYSVTKYLAPPASGTYLLLVTEAGNDGTVGYNIEVSCYSGTCGALPPPAVNSYYFPHLAIAGGWQTTFTYINYSPQSVTCQTTYFSDSGGSLAVPFAQGSASSRTDNLGPGASVHVETTADATAAAVSGWAEAGAD